MLDAEKKYETLADLLEDAKLKFQIARKQGGLAGRNDELDDFELQLRRQCDAAMQRSRPVNDVWEILPEVRSDQAVALLRDVLIKRGCQPQSGPIHEEGGGSRSLLYESSFGSQFLIMEITAGKVYDGKAGGYKTIPPHFAIVTPNYSAGILK